MKLVIIITMLAVLSYGSLFCLGNGIETMKTYANNVNQIESQLK